MAYAYLRLPRCTLSSQSPCSSSSSSPPPLNHATSSSTRRLNRPRTIHYRHITSITALLDVHSPSPYVRRRRPSFCLPSSSLSPLPRRMRGRVTIPRASPQLSVEGVESVLVAVSILTGIVIVHELGHFLAARAQGIKVEKFSIGFGPALYKKKGGDGVEYSLRAIPLGGYVSFPGEGEEEEGGRAEEGVETGMKKVGGEKKTKKARKIQKIDKDDPDLLENRSLLARAIVISAGVFANFVFAFSILLVQMTTVGQVHPTNMLGVKVPIVMAKSAAARAGIQAGDVITGLEGKKLVEGQGVDYLVDAIRKRPRENVKVEVMRTSQVRNGEGDARGRGSVVLSDNLLEITVIPDISAEGKGKIGVQLAENVVFDAKFPSTLTQAVRWSATELIGLTQSIFDNLLKIFTDFGKTAGQVSGPVAIVAVGAELARSSSPPSSLFQFAAVINVNLAVVNLLPLPALDGGYLLLLVAEALRGGEKVDDEVQRAFLTVGALLLFTAGGIVICRDIFNLL